MKLEHCFIIRSEHGDSRICMYENGIVKVREFIQEQYPESQVAILTDSNLASLVHDKIKTSFPEAMLMVVEASEKTKSMATAEQLCSDLLEAGFNRGSVLIGLGGGMITDLAGFVASIFMRGMHYIAMPTSLLAMIDASVGGKTSINLGAKNVIGTFYPAEVIMIDLDFLKTLPERQMKTGVAEVIKYAAVLDAGLEKILLQDKIDFIEILEKGLRTKAEICNKDLKDTGPRRVLNFGHTFGHAIEHVSNYKLTHGEAICIGMMLANKLAQNLGKQKKETGDRTEAMIRKYDLPTELPKTIKLGDVVDKIYGDKKEVTFIISTEMGKGEMVKLASKELMKFLK